MDAVGLTPLEAFLVGLATDAQKLANFCKDPGRALDDAGVTGDAKAAMLSRDPLQIRKALGIKEGLGHGGDQFGIFKNAYVFVLRC